MAGDRRRVLRRRHAAQRPARQDQHLTQGLGRYGLSLEGQRRIHGENGFVSRVHRKKPKGKPRNEATRRANNLKSKVRSHVEHVFAEEKSRMGLFIRTIGIARATTKIGLANLVYNIKRLICLERRAAV